LDRSDLIPDLASVEIDEDKLTQVAKLAELGMSVAAVTHEIRQPLSALKIALQMAREKTGTDKELLKDLGDALDQAIRVEGLVDRTRTFLSPPRGKKPLNLSSVVAGAISMVRWQIEGRRRVEIEPVLEPEVQVVPIDKSLVEQLVSNLLVNARDALLQQGGGRIVVRVGEGPEGVDLVVADNGPGLDPRIADKVFAPFFTTKAAGSGTGLGLYIVKKVAAEHEASVSLMAKEELDDLGMGRLSTGFRVTFPAEPRSAAITSPPPRKRSAETSKPLARRALLVDDEKPILGLLSKLMGQEGYQVVAVSTGEEALNRLEAEEFSVLVTDKNLPGVSGVEVARFSRIARPFMPVLLITGYASEDSALEALAIGVSDYIVKPLDLEDFRSRLRKITGGDRSSRDTRPLKTIEKEGPDTRDGFSDDAGDGISVVLIEGDPQVRGLISDALGGIGCKVKSYADRSELSYTPEFNILIASPAELAEINDWFSPGADGVMGAIALMERGGVDKTIEAIHIGARGIIAPPFDESSVTFDFKRVISRLEREGR